MNRRRSPESHEPHSSDPGSARSGVDDNQRALASRKSAKLCAQIRRTLQLTLLGEFDDEVLQNLTVETVEPAPDDRRLRVLLVVPERTAEHLDRTEVEQRLEAARPVLIGAVADAINRRRCPQLVFALERR